MDELKLAALMCSKVCHDLISPVGAMANGIEVLSEDDDPEMREHAVALLESSAAQAAAKLKFARLAYGASGARGSQVDIQEAEVAVLELLGGGKTDIRWQIEAREVDKDVVKVLVNLAKIACETIPRGGTLSVVAGVTDNTGTATLEAQGPKAKLADEIRAGLDGKVGVDDLDARTIIPHVTGLFAREVGQGIDILFEDERVKFSFTFSV